MKKLSKKLSKKQLITIAAMAGIIVVAFIVSLIIKNLDFNPDSSDEVETAIVSNITIDFDDDIVRIDWSKYPIYEIELSSDLDISNPGVYRLTGEIANGRIAINTDGNVKLELSNVKITNPKGPAIFVQNAKNVVISAVANTTNSLTDGADYDGYADDEIGTIFSHDDLMLEGDGTFVIQSNREDAIVSKDDLLFNGGTYKITSTDDAIRGKDSVYIQSGNFSINSGGAGIKSTNATESDKGSIHIINGQFNIEAKGDAIHADGDLKIENGNFTIASDDDGIHANNNLVIDNGKINITQSYEGIEGTTVTINGGNISVVASDDGLNAAGGNDGSSMNRPGANRFAPMADENAYIRIRGGDVKISSSGDSIDSNGSIYLDGGNIIINGPTNGSDNALDHDGNLIYTGGTLIASEIAGMMSEGISEGSTIYNVTVNFQNTYNSGTLITIEDANGTELAHFAPQKTFSSITFGSPNLYADTTYTIKINGTVYQSFTTSSISTQIGTNNGGMGGGMRGGPQGNRQDIPQSGPQGDMRR